MISLIWNFQYLAKYLLSPEKKIMLFLGHIERKPLSMFLSINNGLLTSRGVRYAEF